MTLARESNRGALFPNPVLYGLLAISMATNLILISRAASFDWHRLVHRDQAVPAVRADEHVLGPDDASVTIVEYSDFQCPFSAAFHEVLKSTIASEPRLRWVFRHRPITELHPMAVSAAEASECASDQGRFWEYTDLLFQRQAHIDGRELGVIARDLHLDEGRFSACLQEGRRSRVAADASAFPEGHLDGTPISFVNGKRIAGAVAAEQVRRVVLESIASRK